MSKESRRRARMPVRKTFLERVWAPQPLVRLELLRILVPLAVLGFMSSRVIDASDWLSTEGFSVPEVKDSTRQPLYLEPLPVWAARAMAALLVVSGLAVAVGFRTRISSLVFAGCLAYVALADRLAAFTVSKLAPLFALVIFFSPAGARWSVDAWLARRRKSGQPRPTLVTPGPVRFCQIFLPVFYFASGVCKWRGDWTDKNVLWTHLHDSYQTPVSWFLANNLPDPAWPVLQGITLAFEVGAPLWFALPWTRPFALGWGVAMHLMIGLMFGPVIWFSLLMITLLVVSYAPARWLERIVGRIPEGA